MATVARSIIKRLFPATEWLSDYEASDFAADSLAGTIVAIMLIPQAMAYALLAGLSPEIGLYASIIPLIGYALFGSSRTLAVGPVAIVSLMTASALGGLAMSGPQEYAAAALILALLSGALLIAMGVAKLGVLVNFLSHPVISGFTSAAALIIGFSQLKHLLGIDLARSHLITTMLSGAVERWHEINPATALLGFGAIAFLVLWRGPLAARLEKWSSSSATIEPLAKLGALFAVAFTTMIVWLFQLNTSQGVAVVGAIPAGLPPFTLPQFDRNLWLELLPAAGLISVVGFLESISVAKSLAARRRQKVHSNKELIALGAANIGAAFSGGFSVTGGFSRSIVNFTAGAITPMASVVTAILVAITVLWFTPLLYLLPKAVLAAVIVVAVASLVDLKTFRSAWRYNKADAASLAATFLAVLGLGIEIGIITGTAISIGLYLWRTSRPHTAIVGRVGDTEHFRNVKRHHVTTNPQVLALRVDESLYFANAAYLEDTLVNAIVDQPEVEDLVLICSAVNFIDASALESLERLVENLRAAGVTLHLAEVKGPVMDMLERSSFLAHLRPGGIFLSTHQAIADLGSRETPAQPIST